MVEVQEQESTSILPLKLFLLGSFLIFVGVIVLVASALLGGDATVSSGVIFFVGPIPIVLGAGPYGFFAVVLAAVLTLIGFVVFFWMRRQFSKS